MDGQVFREVEWITPDGETLVFAPTFEVMQKLSRKLGKRLRHVAQGCLTGDVDEFDLAECHAYMCGLAGAPMTPENSYCFLMGGNAKAIASWQMAFVQSVIPGLDMGKKPDAPAADRKPRTKKKTPARK